MRRFPVVSPAGGLQATGFELGSPEQRTGELGTGDGGVQGREQKDYEYEYEYD